MSNILPYIYIVHFDTEAPMLVSPILKWEHHGMDALLEVGSWVIRLLTDGDVGLEYSITGHSRKCN